MISYARKLSRADGGWLHAILPFCSPRLAAKKAGQARVRVIRQDKIDWPVVREKTLWDKYALLDLVFPSDHGSGFISPPGIYFSAL